MADDSNKEMKNIATAVVSVLDEDTKSYINMWVFTLFPIFIMLSLFGFYKFISDFGNEVEKCWDIKVVNEQAVRINACTGEIKKIENNDISGKSEP